MAQWEKREATVRQNTKAVRQADLLGVLERAGFSCRRGRRGHWTCVHIESQARCTFAEPHGGADSFVKPVYVRSALAALDAARSDRGGEAETPEE